MDIKPGAPADMPFKNTDQWLNLAIRRMMMHASENGYDRIAWTTGRQQADRYDLSIKLMIFGQMNIVIVDWETV